MRPRKALLSLIILALLLAFPLAWSAPLLRAGPVSWFGLSEISILSGLVHLWATDKALALLVGTLALAAPYGKLLGLLAITHGRLPVRLKPWLSALGRLAMADVFLLALAVVIAKGTGLGHVETAWGLWVFVGCVGLSWAVSFL